MVEPQPQSDFQNNILQKIAGFQAVIPQFDNVSAITPKFFIDNVDTVTEITRCSPEEKLLILKSRIKGDALFSVINSPDLSQEKNYAEFKKKFLAFFDTKISLATRQQLFSNCRMLVKEPVKVYAARIASATLKFFHNPDLTNPSVSAIFEQTKLSKFLDGLLPAYKHPALMKDPQSFQEALDFVELLQTNESSLANSSSGNTEMNSVGAINASSTGITTEQIKEIVESQATKTQEIVSALSKEIEKIKINAAQTPTMTNSQKENNWNTSRQFNRNTDRTRNYNTQRQFSQCQICGKSTHFTASCYYNPNRRRHYQPQTFNNRGRGQPRFSPPSHRQQNTDRFPQRNVRQSLN